MILLVSLCAGCLLLNPLCSWGFNCHLKSSKDQQFDENLTNVLISSDWYLHKRQLTENRKLRKENNDLKKKLAEIQNEKAKQTESENDQASTNTEVPDSEHNQNPDLADTEDTQCEIPRVNIPSNIWRKTEVA